MVKHFISVEIIDHRLVSMPHMLTVTGPSSSGSGSRASVEPIRGIAIAAVLSCALWAALIAVVA